MQGSCFAGTFYELALACDRIYMLDLPDSPDAAPALQLNAGQLRLVPGGQRPDALADTLLRRRGHRRFSLHGLQGSRCAPTSRSASASSRSRRTTSTGTTRSVSCSRSAASFSPDAMTGMEASLRFPGKETMETRIFGRLSAWQNWIFIRPNAVGEEGRSEAVWRRAKKARFDWKRV